MRNISILGGGLVGSLLSIYMAKRGYEVDVYERRPDMRKEPVEGGRSINLAMSTRGWNALEEVGLEEEIRKIAIPMKGRMIHNEDNSVVFQAYGKEEQAIYSVSRSRLNMMLDSATEDSPNVRFHYEQKCERVNLRSNTYHFTDLPTGKQYTVEPEVMFGADGAFSRLRYEMQKTPLFNYQQSYLAHGYKELTIPAAEDGGWRIDKNALHIWPREDFMLIALPNLDGSFTCTLFLGFEGKNSFENLQSEEQVKDFFEHFFTDAVPHMPTLISDFFENPTSSLVTVRCFPWTYKNAALIGDASHAIVPFYGQGMNSGFEDCSVLDKIIDEYIGKYGAPDWKAIFEKYEIMRSKDANAIADLALKNFIEMRDWVGEPIFLVRKQIEKYLHKNYPEQFIPVYSMVTFSHARYSEALAESKKQDAFFDELLKLEGIVEQWESGELKAVLEERMKTY